jgi:serine phosphatase RsbU (regulator of sigma subunit)
VTELRKYVKTTLAQSEKEKTVRDGMDIAMAIIDKENMQMQYAGAYNSLYLIRNGELLEYKADRMPIGSHFKEKPYFTTHDIELQQNDILYMFSDGYHDQLGGDEGETKYSKGEFRDTLLEISEKPMDEQKHLLEEKLSNWKGDAEQTDDILVMGIKIAP